LAAVTHRQFTLEGEIWLMQKLNRVRRLNILFRSPMASSTLRIFSCETEHSRAVRARLDRREWHWLLMTRAFEPPGSAIGGFNRNILISSRVGP
jgi:hypothetical protein